MWWARIWDLKERPTALALTRILYQLLPPEAGSAWLIWGVGLLAALTMTLGLFTRTSIVLTLLISAQLALINVPADRGIELVLRDVLLILSGRPAEDRPLGW